MLKWKIILIKITEETHNSSRASEERSPSHECRRRHNLMLMFFLPWFSRRMLITFQARFLLNMLKTMSLSRYRNAVDSSIVSNDCNCDLEIGQEKIC